VDCGKPSTCLWKWHVIVIALEIWGFCQNEAHLRCLKKSLCTLPHFVPFLYNVFFISHKCRNDIYVSLRTKVLGDQVTTVHGNQVCKAPKRKENQHRSYPATSSPPKLLSQLSLVHWMSYMMTYRVLKYMWESKWQNFIFGWIIPFTPSLPTNLTKRQHFKPWDAPTFSKPDITNEQAFSLFACER